MTESVVVIAATLKLRAVVVVVVVVMLVEVVVERMGVAVAAADEKAVMVWLAALKEGGGLLSGKVVVGILDGREVKGEVPSHDERVVLLEGAVVVVVAVVDRPREVAEVAEDSRTGEEEGVEAGVGVPRTVAEVGARDSNVQTR